MLTHTVMHQCLLWLTVLLTTGAGGSLSSKEPQELGFLYVERGPDAQPTKDLLCFADNRTFPLDTSRWWVPAIAPKPSQGTFVRQITPLPYTITLDATSMSISYPYVKASEDDIRAIVEPVSNDWVISTQTPPAGYCLQAADQLTATFAWRTMKGVAMQVFLARGTPYVTVRYTEETPLISTYQSVRKLWIDNKEVPCEGRPYEGHEFLVQLRESDSEWMLWFPPGSSVTCTTGPATPYAREGPPTTFRILGASFSGVVRIALSNNCTTGEKSPSTGAISSHCEKPGTAHGAHSIYRDALRQSSVIFPVSSAVQLGRTVDEVTTTISWGTEPSWGNTSHSPLLMLALPHHMGYFKQGSVAVVPAGGHRNLAGYNAPVLSSASQWTLSIPVTPIPWLDVPDRNKVPEIRHSLLHHDGNFDLDYDAQMGIIDPYNGGKLLARLARLALIADDLGEKKLLEQFLNKLQKYFGVWLNHQSGNLLLYDATWGGLVSCGCHYEGWGSTAYCTNNASNLECPALVDAGFDFGNAWFSDHHFHYGYFIYAAAVLAKLRPSWVAKNDDLVQIFIRDIANPNPEDSFFPEFRAFDWYMGHSWSSGILLHHNGLRQESGGEALNAHYAIYLYGVASGNEALTTTGQALLMTELHSQRQYWQIQPEVSIYPPGYQHTVVGTLSDHVAEFRTSFGKQAFFMFGMQFLPITPVVHLSVDLQWLRRGFPTFEQSCEHDSLCEESGFVTYLVAAEALLYKEAAWRAALLLDPSIFDVSCIGCNGNSRTNLLNFIASSQATTVVPAEFQGNWHTILLGWGVLCSLMIAILWAAMCSPIRHCLRAYHRTARELWMDDDDDDDESMNSPQTPIRQELYFGPDARFSQANHLSAASKYGATS